MQERGLRIICDRCGATGFFKLLKDHELYGGFSRWSEFEPHEEWGRESFDNRNTYCDLCPDCMEQYERMRQDFSKSCNTFMKRKED